MSKRATVFASGAVTLLALAVASGCGGSSTAGSGDGTVESVNDLDALIEAAQNEGELTLYSSSVDTIDGAFAAAFEEEYGISVNSTKLTSAEVMTRYVTEASSGRVLADVIATTCADVAGFAEITEEGWATPAAELGFPALDGDGAEYLAGDGAVYRYALMPVTIGFNTDALSEAEAPKSWEDLLDPRFKGKIVMIDPASSPFYLDFLQWLTDEYGEEFVQELGAQDLQYADAGTARNQLGAGEYLIDIPTFEVSMADTSATGAPVASQTPETTTANESCIAVSAGDHAPHPNAALLYAYFMTTGEGAAALAEGAPGVVSPFGEGGVPDFVAPLPKAEDADHLLDLLGLGD